MIVLDPRVDLSVPINIIPVSVYVFDKIECIIVKSMISRDKSPVACTPMLGLWYSLDSRLCSVSLKSLSSEKVQIF